MTNKKITLSYPVKVIYSSSRCEKTIFEDVDVVNVDVTEGIEWTSTACKAVDDILLIKARRFHKEVLKQNVHSVELLGIRVIDNPYIK